MEKAYLTVSGFGTKVEHQKDLSRQREIVYAEGESIELSDGYHTMDELYDHRITLFIALCKIYEEYTAPNQFNTEEGRVNDVWKSKRHSDGELCFGTGSQFIMGINKKSGEQITYHIPIERWDECDFAETLEKAPEFDGHTSSDVLSRLKSL